MKHRKRAPGSPTLSKVPRRRNDAFAISFEADQSELDSQTRVDVGHPTTTDNPPSSSMNPANEKAPSPVTKETAQKKGPASASPLSSQPNTNLNGPGSASFDGDDDDLLGIGSPVLFRTNLQEPSYDEPQESAEITDLGEGASVEARIREIESRLEGLIEQNPGVELDGDLGEDSSPHVQALENDIDSEEEAVDAARELLESEYFRRKLGRSALRGVTQEVDDFGLDPTYEQRLRPLLQFLYKRYFRVKTLGIHNVPSSGRGVIVSNHSGTLPFDGAMLREAMRLDHPMGRDLRWLAEDFSFYLPFIGVTMNRIGAVRACQENATRLLSKNHLVAAFPEGAEGLRKKYSERYQLQRFGRGGFVRLCLRTNSPIIPCAIVGAEESSPILYRFDNFAKLFGLDYLPVTPTFPALGPLGLLPAPTKWQMRFGEPISVEKYGPEAAQDHVLVGRLAEQVRSSISQMLHAGLKERKSIWL
ncbi:MAG: acyltransferase family protein [Polyangiaceae bacterium]|nr:acyltransferase family protein [Polyangiaceae bacterium]